MNALQHYQTGGRLLTRAETTLPASSTTAAALVAMAQAHFAAALVGATMILALDLDQPGSDLYIAAVVGS